MVTPTWPQGKQSCDAKCTHNQQDAWSCHLGEGLVGCHGNKAYSDLLLGFLHCRTHPER